MNIIYYNKSKFLDLSRSFEKKVVVVVVVVVVAVVVVVVVGMWGIKFDGRVVVGG